MSNFNLGKPQHIACLIFFACMAFPVMSQDQGSVANAVIPDESFLPFYFDGRILPEGKLFHAAWMDSVFKVHQYIPPITHYLERDIKATFMKRLNRNAYHYFVDHYPDQLQYFYWTQAKAMKPEPLKTNIFQILFQVDNHPDFELITSPDKYDPGWKFWFVNGNSLIQFSQNYISKNWYKGGVGNLNMISNQNVTINYSKEKVQFNNYIEWNLSLFTNPIDTMRRTKIGTDLLRTYSDFGIRAFNERWFYSANLEIKTQLFNNYAENTNTIISSLGSPLFINIGILGMKYRLNKEFSNNKYKKFTIDADVSPLSVKITYIGKNQEEPGRYGILAGDKHLTDFGSLINSTLVYNFTKNIWMKSRFKYFTNYKRMEIESENELNIALNRYFSTRIYVYARFDDTAGIPDTDLGYIQMNEILSFGFNYRW